MSSIYITTSRKPSVLTIRLAKALAQILDATKENRGKKSLDDIVQKSSNLGLSRALLIYESHGNPCSLNFYEEKWLEPEVQINHYVISEDKEGRFPKTLKISSDGTEASRRLINLFGIESDDESNSEMVVSKNKIEFKLKEKTHLTIFLKETN